MYSFQPVVIRVCKRCSQQFESRSRVQFYCKPCKPEVKKEAMARGLQKRAAKRLSSRQSDSLRRP